VSIHEVLLPAFALAVLLTALAVAGRLGWCAILAVRARRYRIAGWAAAGMACVAVLLAAVLAWWFLLAVSHRQKDVADTYLFMAFTGIPFFLASFGLWRLAAALGSRLRPGAAEPPAPARAATRRSSRAVAIALAALVFCVAVPVVAAILWLPVALLAGPGSSMLPWPLEVVVQLAAVAAVFGIAAWLARYVYRMLRPGAGPPP
jgi:hypothetical protein